MSSRYRIPVFSKDTISQIAWGMENQDEKSFLNLSDGMVYTPSLLSDQIVPENLVDLPPWHSSDGYQLMVSFVISCKNQALKEKLSSVLNNKSRGVFRRFRDALSENPEDLRSWYDFKDAHMRSYILSWYRRNMPTRENVLENDDLYVGGLLADFDVSHLSTLDVYCTNLISSLSETSPVIAKVLSCFTEKQAFVGYKDEKGCGAIIYEIVGSTACILYYSVESDVRQNGLFDLLFDLFNREMERSHVQDVYIPFSPESSFIRGIFSSNDVQCKESNSFSVYSVKDWNDNTTSYENAYLL